MSKLLRANFYRLRKDVVFYIILLVNTALFAFIAYNFEQDDLESFCLIIQPIVYAVFVAFFVGKEYSNGTIRNKLIHGNTRNQVYFAYLITCVAATLISIIPGIIIFVVWHFTFFATINITTLMMMLIGFLFLHSACCAVFVAISFNISSKAICVVLVALVAFCGCLSSAFVGESLSEPEKKHEYYVDENNEIVDKGEYLNPKYVDGIPRKILLAVFNFTPQAQISEYGSCIASWHLYWESELFNYDEYFGMAFKESEEVLRDIHYVFILNQIVLIGISTAIGLSLFRKKNLK